MAGSVYKGLTIEFRGKTTELSKALREVSEQSKSAFNNLKEINKALKFDTNNVTLLRQKETELTRAIQNQRDRMGVLQTAYTKLDEKRRSGEQLTEKEVEQYNKLEREIEICKSRINNYGQQLDETRQKIENATTATGKLADKLKSSGDSLRTAGASIKDAGNNIKGVGTNLTMGVTVPLVAAGKAVVSTATDIDTALTDVKKTVDGTDEQYQQLKQSAIEFSRTNGVAASQILEIQSLGAQLGYAIDELDEFGRVVSGLDIATNMDAETAAQQVAQFSNIMGTAHSETSNLGSAIVDLGNHFATTEADVMNMGMRIAGAGATIGMTEGDVLGLATALSSVGIQAEAGGTAISTIMANIDKNVANTTGDLSKYAHQANMSVGDLIRIIDEGGEAYDQLEQQFGLSSGAMYEMLYENIHHCEAWADAAKMSATEFAAAWSDDPVQAFAAVLKGMQDATGEGSNLSLMLEDLGIETIRQTDTMKRLANAADLLPEAIKRGNEAYKENTALTAEVENRNQSLEARFTMLQNRLIEVADDIGEPLAEALLRGVDAAEPLFNAVKGIAEAFSNADEGTQQFIVTVAGVLVAIGPVVTVIGSIVGAIGGLVEGIGSVVVTAGVLGETVIPAVTTAFRAMSAALLANPIGIVIAAIAALAAGLTWFFTQTELGQKMWSDFCGFLQGAWDGFCSWFSGTIDSIVGFFGEIGNNITRFTSDVGAALSSAGNQVGGFFADLGSNAKNLVDDIDGALDDAGAAISEWFDGVVSDLGKLADDGIANLGKFVDDAGRTVDNLANTVGNGLTGVGNNVIGFCNDLGNDIVDFVGDLDSNISQVVDIFGDAFGSAFSEAQRWGQSIIDIFRDVPGQIANLFSSLHISFPPIATPHFSLRNWSANPADWITNGMPYIAVDWYAKGGIFDKPSIIGVGEAGSEAVLPINKLEGMIANALRMNGVDNSGGGYGNVSVNVSFHGNINSYLDANKIGVEIGNGITSTLKQQGKGNHA